MRRLFCVLALASACGPAPECSSRADCDDGFLCVNNVCERLLDLDAGPGEDAGAEPDSGAICTRTCGDVDLDRDGDRDDTDFAALGAAVSDPCVLMAADADLDGDYDVIDEYALRALATGDASGPCAGCGACGDVDADGTVDPIDVGLATAAIGETPPICTLVGGDIDRDSDLDQEDAWLVAAIASGAANAECASCEGRMCGDWGNDGSVSVLDVSGLISNLRDGIPLAPCTYTASDVVRDGIVDRRDVFGIFRLVAYAGDPALAACAPCPANETCGDVNDDGAINSGDAIVIANLGRDTTAANICPRARADLNADGQVNERDANLVADMFLGRVPQVPACPVCTLVCGDVNGDGVVSAPDNARLTEIRSGGTASICERDSADANGSGEVDLRDDRLVGFMGAARVSTGSPCAACTGICGDADQNGTVTAADRSVVTSIIDTPRLPNNCEMDDADVDFDGDVDAADRDAITLIIGGTPPVEACGR
jgi:hypothetical protein